MTTSVLRTLAIFGSLSTMLISAPASAQPVPYPGGGVVVVPDRSYDTAYDDDDDDYPRRNLSYYTAPSIEAGDASAVEMCASRFRSFNPDTGTYVTYDGDVRLCPYLR